MNRFRLGLLLVFSIFFTVSALGQGAYEAWVARYNGAGDSSDFAVELAVDAGGNVYVTGKSYAGSNYDYATLKYAPNGDSLWLRLYNGPGNSDDEASDLVLDTSGTVYLTGSSFGSGSNFDFATIKYASEGDSLWLGRYNGPGNYFDYVSAAGLDAQGNLYLTGESWGGGSFEDYTTIKYTPNGDTLWVRRHNGAGNGADFAQALAVDSSGNVCVTGFSSGGGSDYDFATIKYAPNGDTLWVRRYNGTGNLTDFGRDIAVDNVGNVYVTGESWGNGSFDDYATIKYTSNGDTLWVSRYNGPGNASDEAVALALDTSGNVYVTGGSGGIAGNRDYATIKYSPQGDTLWVRRYNGPDNLNDRALALGLDKTGNVYVTGYSGEGGSNEPDIVTIKYASNGDSLWVKRYNGPGNGWDEASALAVDTNGNVYVTGSSLGSSGSYDYATIKYSPCSAVPGDLNASGTITLGDIVHLLNYLFDRDNPPCIGIDPGNCWDFGLICRGDVNNSASITLGDIVHLLNYVFDRDYPPCLGTDPGNCWTPVANGACCLTIP